VSACGGPVAAALVSEFRSVEWVSSCLAAELALAWAGGNEADTEAGTTSREAVGADTGGAGPEDHAICSNYNLLPTTSLRLLESKSIDNNCKTIARPPRGAA
jgi:hypothetical protein